MKKNLQNILLTTVTLVAFSLQLEAQVFINEIMVKPPTNGTSSTFQSIYHSDPARGHEWIELYNSDPCTPVDVSCWTIGGMDGGSNGGAFSFPAGTVMPPLSFLVIGGPNASNVDFNLASFLPINSAQLWGASATRWHLPNGDGWLSLYDAGGTSVDAVYWTFSSNDPAKISSDATYTGVIEQGPNCGGVTLATGRDIFNNGGMEYIAPATSMGQSYNRTIDGGGIWALNVSPTPGNCNGACAPGCTILNFELDYFRGDCEASNMLFEWSAKSLSNDITFVLEASLDAINFEAIDVILTVPNSTSFETYQSLQRIQEHQYFRLKLVSGIEPINYSSIIALSCTGIQDLSAFPNPSSDFLNVTYVNSEAMPTEIGLVDMLGRRICWQYQNAKTGVNSCRIETSVLEAGVYELIVQQGIWTKQKRIIVHH